MLDWLLAALRDDIWGGIAAVATIISTFWVIGTQAGGHLSGKLVALVVLIGLVLGLTVALPGWIVYFSIALSARSAETATELIIGSVEWAMFFGILGGILWGCFVFPQFLKALRRFSSPPK